MGSSKTIKKQGDLKMAKSEAMKEAEKAVKKSQNPKQRPTCLGPEFAQFKIDKNATVHSGRFKYFKCSRTVKGGFVNMFVFGATTADIGKTVSGLVEVRENKTGEESFPYLRTQLVRGETADKKLAFNEHIDIACGSAVNCNVIIGEREFSVDIGFAPV